MSDLSRQIIKLAKTCRPNYITRSGFLYEFDADDLLKIIDLCDKATTQRHIEAVIGYMLDKYGATDEDLIRAIEDSNNASTYK
ncbi:MAG: hypothetical protein KJO69_07745 [Gammaproteobacteria bacterium]|nr:hypothetical protein [Gammaproteobacteria bacterium]